MKYICSICGYIYDDSKEKVKFEDLPNDWVCPLCGAPKSAFTKMQEENLDTKTTKTNTSIDINENDEDMEQLSTGQLSILCSNLARGCEKQYRFEEEKQFKKIAKYLESVTPKEKDESIEKIIDMLNNDINETYSNVNNVVEEKEDRGAKRAILWSEKVTKMINSLLVNYQKQGEDMFKGKDIWICTVCGFIYVGDKLPERCPVCKVPNNKFQKVEGRIQI